MGSITNVGGAGGDGGDSTCSWNWRGSDISALFSGIFKSYDEVEVDKEWQKDLLTPELKPLLLAAITCWQDKLCSNPSYTKGLALTDANANINFNKQLDRSGVTANFTDAIADGVANLALYRVPQIFSDQNADRAYESTCAQLLKCDLGRVLANELESDLDSSVAAAVNISNAENNLQVRAEELRLRFVEVYGTIEYQQANALTRFYDDAVRSYEYFDTVSNLTEHSINGDDLVVELLATVLGGAIVNTVVNSIFGQDINNIAAIMPECTQGAPGEPGAPGTGT